MSIQVVSIGGVSLLQDLLSEDNVSFHYPAETWEDVIRHGGQLMVDAGFTEPTYTEAMIDVTWGRTLYWHRVLLCLMRAQKWGLSKSVRLW